MSKSKDDTTVIHMEEKEQPNFSSSDGPKNNDEDDFQELLRTLDRQPPTTWYGHQLFQYQGFWYTEFSVRQVLSVQKNFKAKTTDIIVASIPKSGTTWLKALTYAIATRHTYSIDQSPLLTSNPHDLVPFLGLNVSTPPPLENPHPGGSILSTHIPFTLLPESVHESGCRIIYICRHPLDRLISHHFYLKSNKLDKNNSGELDEAFDLFCRGIHSGGPFWDHMLGYLNAHRQNPKKVLFLKYEDLKEDIGFNVEKIADFLGLPFSVEEQQEGRIDQISSLCSFEKLSGLEVNKTGNSNFIGVPVITNSSYFRKGDVGDWRNYLTPAMAERFKKVMEIEFSGSGLTFEI